MNTRSAVAALAIIAALPVTAAGATNHDTCFYRRNINGFNAPNDRKVYLRVGISDIYRLDLMYDCHDLSFRQAFGLEDRPSSPWICSPLDATVVFRETGIRQRCPVRAIHKLTPDEIRATPRRDLP